MKAQFSFVVSKQQSGDALLALLLPAIPYRTAEEWKDLLSSGFINVNGMIVNEDRQLNEGDVVDYLIPDHEEGEVDTGWKLLWEGEDVVAIHKPANLPVSRTTRNVYNTLIQLLRRESPWPDAHLLHRLDLETSGIILVGKTKAAAAKYQPKINQFVAKKVYLAWVAGCPDWTELDYECDLNTQKGSDIRCQMYPVPSGEGKLSRTYFKVVKQVNEYSLVQCELKTGRKHQIRAHLNSLGHPIVGDKIYSNGGEFYLKRLRDELEAEDYNKLLTDHHLLHAYQVDVQFDDSIVKIEDDLFSDTWQNWVSSISSSQIE